jgi:GNAT superfamily N-acetyltransferase
MIRKLILKDATSAAQIHMGGMPDDFLPSFGLSFMTKLHRLLIENNKSIALGYFEKNELTGIVYGATNTQVLMYEVFKKGFLHFTLDILRKIISDPYAIKFLWQTLRYGKTNPEDSCAELIIISVAQNVRHKGIGGKLMNKLKQAFKERHITQFKVGTLETNKIANMFYKKYGGKFKYSFRIYDRQWQVYRYTI